MQKKKSEQTFVSPRDAKTTNECMQNSRALVRRDAKKNHSVMLFRKIKGQTTPSVGEADSRRNFHTE